MGLEAFKNADFTLHRVFQIDDRQSDIFWHLGEEFAKKSEARLGHRPHPSVSCWGPTQIKVKNPFLGLL